MCYTVEMSRSDRMFEIIQTLRRAKAPVTAQSLADDLEVTKRTIYRDIATLQGQRVPIAGEAGIGYILRPGFDLPPLMFSSEEVEAISVGLALLTRSGDAGLLAAARRVTQKISDVLPGEAVSVEDTPLHVSGWNAIPSSAVSPETLRLAIRAEQILQLTYQDEKGQETQREIKPLALIYYVDALVLAAWCELRNGFRHFRLDRITSCTVTERGFAGQGKALRTSWEERESMEL